MTSLVILAALSFQADTPAEASARLIGHDTLESRLGDPDLRLLDVRPRANYDAGHIPGAVWADSREIAALAARPDALADPSTFRAWVNSLGITPETEVYVYDNERQRDAARFWWLLRYLGVPKVGLVDGGHPLWVEADRPTATEPTTVEPRPFSIDLQEDRLAGRAEVLALLKDPGVTRIVDARSPGEFTGEIARADRAGHVPGACPLEWSNFVDDQGRFLGLNDLRTEVESAGIEADAPVVAHCQSGGRSSVSAFVFERLGHPTRNYYLGWSDWGNAEETPVDAGSEPEGP